MARQINSADEVIDELGGTTRVAEKFGVDVRVVCNWRKRGLPPEYFHAFTAMLCAAGLRAPPSLWKQKEPVA